VECSTLQDNGGFGLVGTALPGTTLTLRGNTFGGNSVGDFLGVIGEGGVMVEEGDCAAGGGLGRGLAPIAGPQFHIVNVTQAQPVGLDCTAYAGTVLVLPNGDHAVLPCPIQDVGTLSGHSVESLPAPPEGGLNFLSGMEVGLTQNGQAVDPLNGTLQVHFMIPEGQQGSQLRILHWNGTEWEQLNGVVSADGYFEAPCDGIGVFVLVSG
jgi:hypothetical protein